VRQFACQYSVTRCTRNTQDAVNSRPNSDIDLLATSSVDRRHQCAEDISGSRERDPVILKCASRCGGDGDAPSSRVDLPSPRHSHHRLFLVSDTCLPFSLSLRDSLAPTLVYASCHVFMELRVCPSFTPVN